MNFVGFSVIRVLQGSVATYVRCGGISTAHCIANFMLSLAVKEFLKSVKIRQSYGQNLGASFFLEHGVYSYLFDCSVYIGVRVFVRGAQMVLIETVVTGFVDEFPILGLSKCIRFLTTLSVCSVFFLGGVAMTTQVRQRPTVVVSHSERFTTS